LAPLASTALVIALLGGTAGAFAVTERLKLEPSPITKVELDKAFSPTCACAKARARFAFGLREADTLTLALVDEDGSVVRTLARSRQVRAGLQRFRWDGRDERGQVVGEGRYQPRLRLDRARRTILFPNRIEVETTPPEVELLGVGRRVISPDGDGRAEGLTVRYRIGERGRGLLFVDGRLAVRSQSREPRGALHWYGKLGGRLLPAGAYALSVAAEDRFGNRSRPIAAGNVRIAYDSRRRR